jgi:hypothetical protein
MHQNSCFVAYCAVLRPQVPLFAVYIKLDSLSNDAFRQSGLRCAVGLLEGMHTVRRGDNRKECLAISYRDAERTRFTTGLCCPISPKTLYCLVAVLGALNANSPVHAVA